MADLHLITGYRGSPHITSADQGWYNGGLVGSDEYVLANGKMFEAQIITNTTVRIQDGDLVMQGRHVNLASGSYADAIVANGTSSTNRNDLIVVRYQKNPSTGTESVKLAVIQGDAVSGDAVDPSYETASIWSGSTVHDMPLYRVRLSGLNIVGVDTLFKVLAPLADVQHKQNMLINGDFQCNQRGQREYDATGTVMYSVDMWRIFNVKLNVLAEGVKVTGTSTTAQGYLTQFIQLGDLKTTNYTISAMVDDTVYSFTLTPGASAKEKNFGKFKISALTTSTWDDALGGYNNKLKVNICPVGTSTITLTYVDVVESNYASAHVKEDTATAMMRCRRYLQGGATVCPITYGLTTSDNKYQYRCAIGYDPMQATPSLVKCDWHYYNASGTDTTGTADTIDVKANSSNIIQLLTKANAQQKHAQCYGIRAVYLLSCEHAPGGDS